MGNPRGVVGHSWADIPAALSGYLFFQHDLWRLPIFHVAKLGAPSGVNIIFTDSIPWVALAGRLAFQATGATVNLYGVWTAICFVASGVTMTGLVTKRSWPSSTGPARTISLTDPDSRAMGAHSKVGVGYSIQVAVDAKNKLIVEQAVTNQVVDMGLLTQTEKTGCVPHVSKPQRGSSVREGLFRKDP